jgi:transposase
VKEPATLVRITGMAPLQAKVFELARLRCNACNLVFTAPAPEGMGTAKYDETATAMVGLFKYGTGLPWNRLEHVQRWLGMPMPSTTQWELVRDAEPALAPVFAELIRQAAQGQVLHNDDTAMKVLELMDGATPFTDEAKTRAASDSDRTGVYTTGIVSRVGEHRAALFFTGPRHAGENLETVLKQRAAALGPPIQMSDALSHNTAGDFETIAASCLAHARRRFVDVVHDFPEECKFVLEELRMVYKHDGAAKKLRFTDEERLSYHQQLSQSVMDGLEAWMKKQLEDRLVEPNSGLGEAIQYMQKHWSKLTLFLREPGAPLDNNIVEAALKKVILHRKNSLFYRTMNGARVGDTFMSLIHSTELNGGDPFHYLVTLLRNAKSAAEQPAEWMPWTYSETLARASPAPPEGKPTTRASPASPEGEAASPPLP